MELIFNNKDYNNILKDVKNKDINISCPICRDDILYDTIKLDCGHIYDSNCLLDSFLPYDIKKCPLCDKDINLDLYLTSCNYMTKDNKKCGRKCYNQTSLCSKHINLLVKQQEKEKNKIKNNLLKDLNKKMKQKEKIEKQLSEINNYIYDIQNKINNLT